MWPPHPDSKAQSSSASEIVNLREVHTDSLQFDLHDEELLKVAKRLLTFGSPK